MCYAASDDLTQDKWLGAMQWCCSAGAAVCVGVGVGVCVCF